MFNVRPVSRLEICPRMLCAIIRSRDTELKHPISPLERQFAAACLEHDLGDKDRTWVREGFIDLWLKAPESALPIFGRAYIKRFNKFRGQLSEVLPDVQMPTSLSPDVEQTQEPFAATEELYGPPTKEDEMDKTWAQDDYNTRSWDILMSDMYPTMRSNALRSDAHHKKWALILEELSSTDTKPEVEARLDEISGSLPGWFWVMSEALSKQFSLLMWRAPESRKIESAFSGVASNFMNTSASSQVSLLSTSEVHRTFGCRSIGPQSRSGQPAARSPQAASSE
ncbi:unnamed protein product [Zymoseptoria tritici ST99CH_1A5]|uniref:Uncharacterized protein n=2 Tax=Zymoseptoria tritici TaxID=1047171 RepID=A0A2H1H421_ZYMTR|nr:unnamed protein product [Zymoseptoria tritici ST99CH_1E4]SMY29029.1 unnamed protein product [Zymoseptoria tritici ST99CH_1A5]